MKSCVAWVGVLGVLAVACQQGSKKDMAKAHMECVDACGAEEVSCRDQMCSDRARTMLGPSTPRETWTRGKDGDMNCVMACNFMSQACSKACLDMMLAAAVAK